MINENIIKVSIVTFIAFTLFACGSSNIKETIDKDSAYLTGSGERFGSFNWHRAYVSKIDKKAVYYGWSGYKEGKVKIEPGFKKIEIYYEYNDGFTARCPCIVTSKVTFKFKAGIHYQVQSKREEYPIIWFINKNTGERLSKDIILKY